MPERDRPITTAERVEWSAELVLRKLGVEDHGYEQQVQRLAHAIDSGELPEQAVRAVYVEFPELNLDA